MNISILETIYEFTNRQFSDDGFTGGVYFVMVDDKRKIFIRNGDSIGVVNHFLDEPVKECVPEISREAKKKFLMALEKLKTT